MHWYLWFPWALALIGDEDLYDRNLTILQERLTLTVIRYSGSNMDAHRATMNTDGFLGRYLIFRN